MVTFTPADLGRRLIPPKKLSLAPIDPAAYFITSGDGIKKIQHGLLPDLRHHHEAARLALLRTKPGREPVGTLRYLKKLEDATQAAERAVAWMIEVRGTAIHLETTILGEGRVVLEPKNPKIKAGPKRKWHHSDNDYLADPEEELADQS